MAPRFKIHPGFLTYRTVNAIFSMNDNNDIREGVADETLNLIFSKCFSRPHLQP